MSSSIRDQSPATKVFSIAELAEQILLDFISISDPHKTANISLLGIKRVSHSFNNTITNTPSLRRILLQGQRPGLEYFRNRKYGPHRSIDITMSHGAYVHFAFSRATECWIDTEGQLWRGIVFLGTERDSVNVDFGNVKMRVEAEETFGSVVERVKELLMKVVEHRMVMIENARAYGVLEQDEGGSWTIYGQ